MGYTTDFFGSFKLDKPLTDIQIEYLNMFSDTRRMKRDIHKLATMKAHGLGNIRCFELLEELGLGFGIAGEFYCGVGFAGQDMDESVVDGNFPSNTQPGLWCKWIPTDDRIGIHWSGGEKFYDYVEWLEYLIKNFLSPWGYKVNGMVEWRGEDHGDVGIIRVVDNMVTRHPDETLKSIGTINTTLDIMSDLKELSKELSSSKKGTSVACKKIAELIKKHGG